MKNWIARLFKGAGDGTPADTTARPAASLHAALASPGAAAAPATAATPAPDGADAALPAIEQAFWRWLCGLPGSGSDHADDADAAHAAGVASPPPRLILDELARLARAPGEAANLVPRVPEVIPRLLRSLREEGVSGAELARQVTQDAVLVAEVIREANSPFYRAAKPVRTVDAALLVLGQNGLRMLLARVAFRPIIGAASGRCARRVAPRLWQHSERCARAGALLAAPSGADPFEAYLAGLMLDVGLIVAFRLIDQLQDGGQAPRDAHVVDAILAGARQLSARIALHWELPPPIGAAILGAGRADAQPLARALGEADRLAMLRLLLEHGIIAQDDPRLAELGGARARAFERIGAEAE